MSLSNFLRASQIPIFTSKEDPRDAQVDSHRLLVRAGFIRKQASGLYSWLPFGWRLHRMMEQIIREEMDASGAVEVHLPILTTAELWRESGRFEKMGPEMMKLKDRHANDFVLAPTHEEAMTALARGYLQSYKQLPINFYQIGTKYRDEIRPRFGLIRCREFVMKDAYSFHENDESLDETYQTMRQTYRKIFERAGLKTLPVQADSGNMGGAESEEFMVASEIGEETLLLCEDESNCGYRSNIEKTPVLANIDLAEEPTGELETVSTPNLKSIEEVSAFLDSDSAHTMKAVVLANDSAVVVSFLPGEREANVAKIQNASGESNLELPPESEIHEALRAPAGFLGPIGYEKWEGKTVSMKGASDPKTIHVLFDRQILERKNLIAGANKKDYHVKNLNPGRDFPVPKTTFDLSAARAGDLCPACQKNHLVETKGIEVGHIFKLGKKYTETMNLSVLDTNGKPMTPTMGCYGIGVGRTIATVVEQNHDENGICWPPQFTPVHVYMIPIIKDETQMSAAVRLAESIAEAGLTVYFDDRSERPGVKFNDADLIGIPVQIIAGKSFIESGKLEVKIRKTGEKKSLSEKDTLSFLQEFYDCRPAKNN